MIVKDAARGFRQRLDRLARNRFLVLRGESTF